jgi:nucleoid-associated protein YgaU
MAGINDVKLGKEVNDEEPKTQPKPAPQAVPQATPQAAAQDASRAAPVTAPQAAPLAAPTRAPQATFIAEHTVVAGETLSQIALKHYKSAAEVDWRRIYEANKDIIGNNPGMIKAGMVLKIPLKA